MMPLRRRISILIALVFAALGVAVAGLAGAFDGGHRNSSTGLRGRVATPDRLRSARSATEQRGFLTVGLRTLGLYDHSRGRKLVTLVLYPGRASHPSRAERDAPPAGGGFPLVVFGHGFAVTPAPYRPLLDRWVRAGFVVAAPLFPFENEHAPGGPDENDLPNQAGDMIYVIRALRRLAAPHGKLAGLIDGKVAVAGQSDGGDTALAAAYDPAAHSIPIDAAVILSGAEDPFAPRFHPLSGTPLLATQGTADTVNLPSETFSFFNAAGRPKYLLLLEGAEHQPPYTQPGPELDAVARTSIAFMDRYLKDQSGPLARLTATHRVGPGSVLRSYP